MSEQVLILGDKMVKITDDLIGQQWCYAIKVGGYIKLEGSRGKRFRVYWVSSILKLFLFSCVQIKITQIWYEWTWFILVLIVWTDNLALINLVI